MDNEIQILISAVDNISATVNKIESNLDSMNTNVQAQTEATSMSFSKVQGNLLLLGQTVASVDHIFDSYENLQLRLENATDRVSNAQDRLAKAQMNLKQTFYQPCSPVTVIYQKQVTKLNITANH